MVYKKSRWSFIGRRSTGEDKRSLLETCRLSAPNFLLGDRDARDLIDGQVATITRLWSPMCEEAELTTASSIFRRLLMLHRLTEKPRKLKRDAGFSICEFDQQKIIKTASWAISWPEWKFDLNFI